MRARGAHFRRAPLAAWALAVIVALIATSLTVLPVLGPTSPASAATISFVQGVGSSAATTAAVTTQAFSSNTTAGNTVIVAFAASGKLPVVCTDSQGNAYTTVQQGFDSGNTKSLSICYANNIVGGADTVTVTISDGTKANRRIFITEYANIADYNPVDVTTVATGAGTTVANGVSSGSVTTTADGALIFGAVEDTGTATSINPGTGFVERGSVLAEELEVQDMIQTTAGPVASTHTFGAAQRWISEVVAFRPQNASVVSPSAVAGDGIGIRGETLDDNTGTAYGQLYDSATNSLKKVAAFGGMGVGSIIRTSPNKREAIGAWQDWHGDLFVGCYDGTSWTVDFVAKTVSVGDVRPFDVAYETGSGDALVAYSNTGTTTSIAYRTKPGTAGCGASNWSSATTLNPARSNATVYWVKLAADRRSGSNLIGMAFADDAQALSAMIWNGTGFTNEPSAALESTTVGLFAISYNVDTDVFDLEWESGGNLMVVWGNNSGLSGTNGAYYARCTGGTSGCTWTAPARIGGATGDDAANVDISANPLTNEIVYASVSYAASDLQVGYWNGSTWTLTPDLDTTTITPASGTQFVATGYLVHGNVARSIVAFSDATIGDVRYYVGNGSNFGTADSPLTYDITNTASLRSLSIAVDPINPDRLMLSMVDTNFVGWMKRATLDGSGAFNWTSPDNNVALDHIPQTIGSPLPFAFWRNPSLPSLTQNGYIFENDDEDQATGDYVDENTQQAAGNTAISNVRKGERVTARFQVSNSGAPLSSDLGLFYDRNDGIWSKVQQTDAPEVGSGTCNGSALFDCSAIDTSADVGYWSNIAVDRSGAPWVAYTDYDNLRLKVAHYVGTGGTGCATTAWTCSTIGATTLTGEYAHIAIDSAGNPWISHYDTGNFALRVARYVGTGGTGCGSNAAWSCELVDNSGDPGKLGTSIAFDSTGTAYMAYYSNSAEEVRVARYVGSGGNCPSSTKWNCQTIEGNGDTGQWPSIAFDTQNRPWVSFYDVTDGELWLARYVEAGGTGCSGTSQWTCGAVDTGGSGDVGGYTGIAFDGSGTPWISYKDWGNGLLNVAKYVGSGGSCSNTAWSCTTVDDANSMGEYATIAMDASGRPWIASADDSLIDLRVARYVGSGGTGCADSAWSCVSVETTNDVGRGASIAFAPDGRAWISYLDSTNGDLRIARLKRGGEITMADGLGGGNGDSLFETHTDMTTSTNTANRDDADCTTAGAYFNQGAWFESEDASNVRLPGGIGTKQCTEVAFMLDTSQATPGTTYRFMVASEDAMQTTNGLAWRGPDSVTNYATLTIEAASTLRVAKDAIYNPANCSTAPWSCVTVDSASDVRFRTGLAFDNSGVAWSAYQNGTVGDIWVTRYVGSGGTGCATTQWTCYVVDSTNDLEYPSLAVDPSGRPWIAYYDNTAKKVRIANYVGSGGSGCASALWNCTDLYTTTVAQPRVALAFDHSGTPYVAFGNSSSYLTVAKPVTGKTVGTGCASSAWQCDVITGVATAHPAIAVDSAGNPWIAYRETTGNTMYVAHFVGSGGAGCTATSWSCVQVDSTSTSGWTPSIAISSSDVPWVAYRNDTSGKLRVASFAAGTGCASAAWTCTDVMTSTDSKDPSIAFDSSGAAWISFSDETLDDLWTARYMGSGGTGCASTAWSCATVDTNNSGYGSTLAFDASGVPWISYIDYTAWDLKVAVMQQSPAPGSYKAVNTTGQRNAAKGDARYPLDFGDVSRPAAGTCDANATGRGYCSVDVDDTQYDSMTAAANEAPVYTLAGRGMSNSGFPAFVWTGQSSVAASTKAVKIEVFRFGSTNAWTTLSTNTTAAANTDFTLTGTASAGSATEYWQADGSDYWTYFRVWQVANSAAETLTTDRTYGVFNAPPYDPSSLAQVTTTDSVLNPDAWVNSTSVKFTAMIKDRDKPDTIKLCVEAKPIASAFTNTENSCGSAVAYSTVDVAASVTLTLSDATQYHWQARVKDAANAYSGWVPFYTNSDVVPAESDFGIDITAPGAGSVKDGTSAVTDATYNDGTLDTLSATWTGFNANVSGIDHYEYTIGTSIGGTQTKTATSVATATTVTVGGLSLSTNKVYYFRVYAYDKAGNVTTADSNGQFVAPTLTFTSSSNTIDFGQLNLGNNYKSDRTLTITVKTNAANGYQVLQRASGVLTSASGTVAMYGSPWSAPTSWTGYGLGYTSSDNNVVSINRFVPNKYAGISTGSADVVADSSVPAPITADSYTLSYHLETPASQASGRYRTVAYLSAIISF